MPRVVFNPRTHFDASAGVFVMEYRSASSGEIERQFPDEQQLRAYENAKKIEAARSKGEAAAAAVKSSLDANVDVKSPAPAQTSAPLPAKAEKAPPPAPAPASASTKAYEPVRLEV
ncbi:hypothetical protein [Azospirillum sp. sgz301742]